MRLLLILTLLLIGITTAIEMDDLPKCGRKCVKKAARKSGCNRDTYCMCHDPKAARILNKCVKNKCKSREDREILKGFARETCEPTGAKLSFDF